MSKNLNLRVCITLSNDYIHSRIAALFGAVALILCLNSKVNGQTTQIHLSLDVQRAKFNTVLKKTTVVRPAQASDFDDLAESDDDFSKPDQMQEVTYHSGRLSLGAWLILPHTPAPHPVVVIAHSGFRLDTNAYQLSRPFVEAGYAVLMPSWRGENGNSGHFEFCYGEVDDALNALNYIKTLPTIDSARVYAVGYGTGGTLVMLLSELKPQVRAIACIGGSLFMSNWVGSALIPFAGNSAREVDLRSPGLFVADIAVPVELFYGDDDGTYILQAKSVLRRVRRLRKHVGLTIMPETDHNQAFMRANPLILKFFGSY